MEDNKNIYDSPPMNDEVINMQAVLHQNIDIRGGKEKIHRNKEKYFKKLESQSNEQFAGMVEMAPVYVLYPKVVDGFVGVIFAKEPKLTGVDFNSAQKKQNKNVDMLGNSIDKFSESVVGEVIENGFCATMNDYSNLQNRTFIRLIKPHQFISFRTNSDEGYPKISQFIFKEEIELEDDTNEFDTKVKNQYTVLDFALNPNNNNLPNYRVRIFEGVNELDNTSKAEKMIIKSSVFPKIDGKFFDVMPLTIHGIESNNFSIKKSLLQDISDMNISVMQRVVDQTYMLHWTALPTPYIIGAEAKDSPDTIGPSKVWYITDSDASVGMLEFSGNSAKAHQDFIDNLLYIMATTGAQILKREGVSRETATSVLVRTASQTSLVSTMVKNVSGQLEASLKVYFEWSKAVVTDDYKYKLNDDFIKVDMDPNAQIALVKSWLDGAISHKTLFNKMKEGEIVQANKTFEDELTDIRTNPPPFFLEKLKGKLDKAAAKILGKSNKNELKGSNLDNGNFNSNM